MWVHRIIRPPEPRPPRREPGSRRGSAFGPAAARWLIALLGCAVAGFIFVHHREAQRRQRPVAVAIEGTFPRDGHYPDAGRFAPAPDARAWGSWNGSDHHQGTLTLGPFRAPRRLVFGVAGYPTNEGNGIFLELASTGERLRVPADNAGETWQQVEFFLPGRWRGRSIRLTAVDDALAYGGWLGITEPLPGRGSGVAARRQVLQTWSGHIFLAAIGALAVGRWAARRVPGLQASGPAMAVALFLAAAAPWAAYQHAAEPHFTTMLVGVVGSGMLAVLLIGMVVATPRPVGARAREVAGRLRAWWREPALNAWVVGAVALLLFLRKPDSLHTPQLYAEDGSIFLEFNDALGARAFLVEYMGYLHLIPRLTAWMAAQLLDVAWWPEFYNGLAFAIWVAVIARTFSRRFPLPGKPWLALAFVIGPQTGEVLFNITNVHWISAFVLIQHVLLARPAGTRQRVFDIAILAVVGLTGPFSLAFAPLFLWHWWRDRNAGTLAALLVVGGCAVIQAWTILTAGKPFDYQSATFHLWPVLEVIGRRVLVWPVAGSTAALAWPKVLIGTIGVAVIGPLLVWTLRPHPQRELRARVVAAFLLILAVGVYRIRPDVWAADDLVYGDRYFYIPRVLLGWLLVLQFHAIPRAIAWAARGLWLAIAVVHLPHYILPAPPDYHWKQHCDPIRRGEPADIKTLPEGWWIEYRGRPKR